MNQLKTGIKVSAPAVVSNLACGFDVLALALDQPSDEMVIHAKTGPGIELKEITGDKKKLSLVVEENTAGLAALKTWEHFVESGFIDPKLGLSLELRKKINIGSGLGSSAASAVVGAVAVNEAFGRPLEQKQLLPFAVKGHLMATGSRSIEAVAASLWGGWIMVRDAASLDVRRLPIPRGLQLVIVQANQSIVTIKSRAQLAEQVSLDSAVKQSANLAALIFGLYNTDFELIKHAMTDAWIEPQREAQIPFFRDLQRAALNNGALACSIAGSGPAIFALCNNSNKANDCLDAMTEIYQKQKIKHKAFISSINPLGAKKE